MFKILSLVAVVIQLLPVNGLTVTSRENTHRFDGIIEENFAANFDVQTQYENFGLSVEWKAKLPEEFGYHVAIEKKSVSLAYCSGAIVEEDGIQIVITSARCVEGHSADDLVIRYNSAEREIGGSLIDVKEINLPFGADPTDLRLPIAILYPAGRISNKGSLRFPSSGNSYENAVVTGWPSMYPVNTHSNLLLYTKQPLLSESECGTHNGFLCAGVRSNKTSYCYVTTGSPLVATKKGTTEKVLIGFLMSDKGCRREITPTPYLDVTLFASHKNSFFKK